RGKDSGGKTVSRKRAHWSRSTRAGSTSQSKRSANKARAEAVMAGRPKNGTGIPSFIFWSASRQSAWGGGGYPTRRSWADGQIEVRFDDLHPFDAREVARCDHARSVRCRNRDDG